MMTDFRFLFSWVNSLNCDTKNLTVFSDVYLVVFKFRVLIKRQLSIILYTNPRLRVKRVKSIS